MLFLFLTANDPHKGALVAPVNNGWTCVLVREQLFVRHHLLAPFVQVAAPKLNFAKQVPRHSVHSVELTLVPAKGAGVWVLLKPVSFTVTA